MNVLMVFFIGFLAGADTTSTTQKMDFISCKELVAKTVAQSGAKSKRLVDTGIMQMTKIFTSDAELFLTCSKPDGQLTITTTPK